jgi:hypothetical protein
VEKSRALEESSARMNILPRIQFAVGPETPQLSQNEKFKDMTNFGTPSAGAAPSGILETSSLGSWLIETFSLPRGYEGFCW